MGKKENLKINYLSAVIIAIAAIIIIYIVSVKFNAMELIAVPSNFIGALSGALIGAIITFVLLLGQTNIEQDKRKLEEEKNKDILNLEEKKERDIRILEMKTPIFQDFIDSVWEVWKAQEITIEKFDELTNQYYQNLMIYLKDEKKLKDIGEALTKIGHKIDKTTYEDSLELRGNIVKIINILSKDIDLGGEIDETIMDEHDKIIFPIRFKKELLNKLNEALRVKDDDSPLQEGKFEYIQEFRNEPSREYLCFDFKKYKGCKIVIDGFDNKFYDDIKKEYLHKICFSLFIDTNHHEFDDFRIGVKHKHRINHKEINLLKPVEGEENAEQSPQINFTDEKSMDEYRTKIRGFAPIFAGRIKYWFEEIKIEGDNIHILEFIKRYYKEQT